MINLQYKRKGKKIFCMYANETADYNTNNAEGLYIIIYHYKGTLIVDHRKQLITFISLS